MHIPCSSDDGTFEAVLTRAMTPPEPTSPPAAKSNFGQWAPPIDVKIADNEIVVFADLPGVDEDHVMIEVLPDELILAGEREFDMDREDPEDYVRLDRPYGPFELHIPLPHPVDPNEATAKYRRGVLRIRLPFAERPYRGRRVQP